jgi:hypothetical protein
MRHIHQIPYVQINLIGSILKPYSKLKCVFTVHQISMLA